MKETKGQPGNVTRNQEFWSRHPGIVWSNRQASDSVMIANALLTPNFHLLLDIAAEFGLTRLKTDWDTLSRAIPHEDDPTDQARLRRAAPIVNRCLRHMEEAVHA